MKGLALILLFIILGAVYLVFNESKGKSPLLNSGTANETQNEGDLATVIAEDLDTPWGIAFLPDGNMLVTERSGTVRLVQNDGSRTAETVANLSRVKEIGEGGLLGITLHPTFTSNNFVYLYYTYDGSSNPTLNRVVRMKFENNSLSNEEIIVDAIPGASNHNGGRIKFGSDGNLYITTGDAQNPSQAQSRNSLAGKVLRTTDEGKAVSGNPFGNLVYSYGHRNPQGIAWDANGSLWETEHGRSGALSGLDEINFIESGKNYGWDTIQGDETQSGLVTPVRHSGSDTWAPSGAAFAGSSLFFSGLRGQALYEAVIQDREVTDFKEHFKGEFGRIREVILGPDSLLYITTSNQDGRGSPKTNDDKIIRINPGKLN